MDLVGVRRSWLAVVAVLGLVGSLLAVGVVPAAAADGEADNGAVYSACVGPALESLGLTDVEGSFAEDAVNCLGHYGITKGRTATTYDPGAPVLRWQMALFLTRAAGPAGVSLLADPADDFTDLGDASDETRSAVNQMAGLEIMSGTGSGRFSPDTAVSRKTMAEMLDAFLGKARRGAGAFGGEDKLSDVSPDDTVFTDIGNVTRGQYSAIRRMFEVGVTRGTSDSQFSPDGLVTRGQMAAFITRMLAHTVARPAGLTMQANKLSVAGTAADPSQDVDLVVSLRDSAHMAMPDASVDLFKSTNPGDAFGSDGSCSNDDVMSVGNGAGKCEIASSDETTNSDGDVEITGGDLSFGASATVWAWTGDLGAKFKAGDTVSASVEITVTKPATKLQITDDMAANAKAAKFGDRVTFTIQVVDDDGNAVATKDESVTVFAGTTVASAATNATPATGSSTVAHKTDDTGKIELSYRQTDPRTGSGNGGDKAWLNLDITYDGDLELVDKTTLKMAKDPAGRTAEEDAAVVWRDDAAKAATLTLAQAVSFHEASGTGSGAANTVTATLVDQYGDPVSRQKVAFTSDDADGIGAEAGAEEGAPAALVFDTSSKGTRQFEDADALLTRTTNRRGVASLTYNRKSSDSGIETILASVTVGSGATAITVDADRIYHYWANELSDNADASGRLLATDTDNNQLVILGGGEVSLIRYDSNDQFTSIGDAATLSKFETDLKDADKNAGRASATDYRNASKHVSQISSLEEPWSKALDTEAGANYAVDHGVFVVAAPSADIMCDADSDPATADVLCAGAGKVYVYEADADGAYGDPVTLESPGETAGGMFGADVDIGIGGTHIVVGAPGEGAGKLYIFSKGASGWGTGLTMTFAPASTPSGVDKLGLAVAISRTTPDVDPNHYIAVKYDDKVVRWRLADDPATDGFTWTLPSSTVHLSTGTYAFPVGGSANTLAVANNGTAFFGVPNAGSGGAIRAFRPGSPATFPVPVETGADAEGLMLGASVSVADDASAAAVGAPGGNAVYVLTSDSWANAAAVTVVKLSDSDAELGSSVAISSDGATVAAAGGGDVAALERGEVFAFAKGSGDWAAQTSGTPLGTGSSLDTMFNYLVAFDTEDDALHAASPIGGVFMDIYEVSTS